MLSSQLANNKKKVGILVRSLPVHNQIGGSEKQAVELGEELSKKHDVTIFFRKWSLYVDKSRKEQSFKVKAIPFINFPILRYVSYVLFGLAKLKSEKKNLNVLFCFGLGPESIISILAKLFFKIPYAVCIRAERFEHSLFSGWRYINKLIIKKANFIIAQTQRMKQLFLKQYPNDKTIVIPNGIRIVKERASGDKIVYAGRLVSSKTDDKGVKYLIDALKELRVESLIIGYGPEEEKLKERSKDLKVEFTGKVEPENMISYLKKGKIFVLPSLTEGFPNVILEAMSVGLPVIATKVGGIPDIIIHGKSGFLVKTRDSRQIRDYIELLLNNNKLYRRMSLNCLKEVQKYYWPNIIKKYEKILSEINK